MPSIRLTADAWYFFERRINNTSGFLLQVEEWDLDVSQGPTTYDLVLIKLVDSKE